MMPAPKSSTSQADTGPQSGSDMIVQYMIRKGIPLTKANFVDLMYMGDVPNELPPDVIQTIQGLKD